MIVKMASKIGGGSTIAIYLMKEEGRGIKPELVKGDLERTRDLINSIERKYSYTHGVISFHKDDCPSVIDQEKVIEDFEHHAFAGLEKDQFDISWVRHEDKGRIELHFVTPMIELHSGKQLNIDPHNFGVQKYYNDWAGVWNCQKNWARPDAPEHQQKISMNPFTPSAIKGKKEELGAYVEALIASGEVQNRRELLAHFEEIGLKINRQNEKGFSLADRQGEKLRLQGVLFEEKDYGDIRRVLADREREPKLTQEALGADAKRDQGLSKEQQRELRSSLAKHRKNLERGREKRSAFYRAKFGEPEASAFEAVMDVSQIRADIVREFGALGERLGVDGLKIEPSEPRSSEDISRAIEYDYGRDTRGEVRASEYQSARSLESSKNERGGIASSQGNIKQSDDQGRGRAHFGYRGNPADGVQQFGQVGRGRLLDAWADGERKLNATRRGIGALQRFLDGLRVPLEQAGGTFERFGSAVEGIEDRARGVFERCRSSTQRFAQVLRGSAEDFGQSHRNVQNWFGAELEGFGASPNPYLSGLGKAALRFRNKFGELSKRHHRTAQQSSGNYNQQNANTSGRLGEITRELNDQHQWFEQQARYIDRLIELRELRIAREEEKRFEIERKKQLEKERSRGLDFGL